MLKIFLHFTFGWIKMNIEMNFDISSVQSIFLKRKYYIRFSQNNEIYITKLKNVGIK